MALATTESVAALLGLETLESQQERLASALLGLAESRLVARLPGLLTRADTDPAYADLVVGVEAEAVARVLRNPEGFRSEGVGPWNYTIDTRAAAGFLTILDDEWADLGWQRAAGAFTIEPYLPAPTLPPGMGLRSALDGWS